jgi:hypothetical protein
VLRQEAVSGVNTTLCEHNPSLQQLQHVHMHGAVCPLVGAVVHCWERSLAAAEGRPLHQPGYWLHLVYPLQDFIQDPEEVDRILFGNKDFTQASSSSSASYGEDCCSTQRLWA